jgi:hypothetical protein
VEKLNESNTGKTSAGLGKSDLLSDVLYRICWKSNITGATGKGKPLSKATAEQWLEDTSLRGSTLTHWIEAV